MSGIELQTAKYFKSEVEEPDSGDAAGNEAATERESGTDVGSGPRTSGWESAAGWIGVGVAAVAVACVAIVAVPMLSGIKRPKSTSPIDLMLWLGGAKSDQTFETFLKDTATKNQIDWGEKNRQSPMYPFKGIAPIDLNTMQGMQSSGKSQRGR